MRKSVVSALLLLLVIACLGPLPSPCDAASKNKYNGKKQVAAFQSAIRKDGFSTFYNYLNATGMFPILESLMNNFQLTCLAPTNEAFKRSRQRELFNPDWSRQIMAFHCFAGKYNYKELQAVTVGAKLKTLDYNLPLVRVSGPRNVVRLGSPNSQYVGKIVKGDVYFNPNNAVHGIDTLLRPPTFET